MPPADNTARKQPNRAHRFRSRSQGVGHFRVLEIPKPGTPPAMGDHEAVAAAMLNAALLLPWPAPCLLSNVMAGAAIEAEFMEAVKGIHA